MTSKYYLLLVLVLIKSSLYAHMLQNFKSIDSLDPNYLFEARDNIFVFGEYKISSYKKRNHSNTDSLKSAHGLVLEHSPFHDFRIYNIGYEFTNKKSDYTLGAGLTLYYNQVVGYSSYSLGSRFFIELGSQFGVRLGLDSYYIWLPGVIKLRIDDIIPVNTPMRQLLGVAPTIGGFYKTKNQKFQFIGSINFDHVMYETYRYDLNYQVTNKWLRPVSALNLGFILKYNFLRK